MSWPPEDAKSLLTTWQLRGSPEIQLGPGTSIIDLVKWFDPIVLHPPAEEDVLTVREALKPKPKRSRKKK